MRNQAQKNQFQQILATRYSGVSLIFHFLMVLAFFLAATPARAAITVKIIDYPASISAEPFTLTVEIQGVAPATNYLRVDLYQPDTTNYFGETHNGSGWYGGSSGLEYLPIEILSKDAQLATLSARLGEPSPTRYPGPGSYLLRVRRYTASGNQGGETPEPVALEITHVWPSPSPSPSPSPVSSAAPSATPPPPPASPSPSSPPPSPLPSPSPSLEEREGTVAGLTISSLHFASPIPSPSPPASWSTSSPSPSSRAKSAILTGSGLLVLALTGYLLTHRSGASV